MFDDPDFIVSPTGYKPRGAAFVTNSVDPLGAAIRAGAPWSKHQCTPGRLPRAKGPFNGKVGVHVCGWDVGGTLSTTITRDNDVGSTDAFILGNGDTDFTLEKIVLEADDRAAVKTTTDGTARFALIDCIIKGDGSPHEENWQDCGKWGCHTYRTSKWYEIRCYKYSICGEHGGYHHNIQGDHGFTGGATGMCGGCDLFFANRMNEGPIGVGNITIQDRYTEDVCIGQGGSALTFRGGMPNSVITINRWKCRLGTKASLAAPFNQNICGAIVTDSADETAPGKGDAAYPGGQKALHLSGSDIEVGTIWPGRTGMIRPIVAIDALSEVFTMASTSIRVKRAAGAYPIALSIRKDVKKVAIEPKGNELVGWVEWHPGQPDEARYTSLDLFLTAHPECVA
jgi:hypothetical protein